MKKLYYIAIAIIISLFSSLWAFAMGDNIRITTENSGRNTNNSALEQMGGNEFFYVGATWEKWIKNLLLNIARDLRVIIFALVLLVAVIMVIKLIFWDNTEEESKNLKMGILWSTIGIIMMQVAYSLYKVFFDRSVDAALGRSFVKNVMEPMTDMLLLLASFVFLAMGIYAFYKIITAWGDDDKISQGKTTIIQAIIWFIVIKFSDILIKNTLNPDCWGWGVLSLYGAQVCENMTQNAKIITIIINWINTFLAIIIVFMVLYAGFLILTSNGDSDKQDKAKKILLYIWIGLLILFMSYLILTFFIKPETII